MNRRLLGGAFCLTNQRHVDESLLCDGSCMWQAQAFCAMEFEDGDKEGFRLTILKLSFELFESSN